MPNLIKVALCMLLFSCLLQLPYGYYLIVRYIALIGFTVLAYHEFFKTNEKTAFAYVLLAFLFQPIFKIALTRELWLIVDALVGAGLLLSLFDVGLHQKDS